MLGFALKFFGGPTLPYENAWFGLLAATLMGVIAPNAMGQATRFVGSYTAEENQANATIQLKETNDSFLTVAAKFSPTWDFDLTTDGQTVTFNHFRVSFSGNVPIPSGSTLVSIDLVFELTEFTNVTLDINPVGNLLWDIEPHRYTASVSGVYHSLSYSMPFATIANSAVGDTVEPNLYFFDWPNTIAFQQPTSGSDRTTTFTPPNEVLLEPFLKLDQLTLTFPGAVTLNATTPSLACPCCDCGDFDHDADTDGADFLVWQQGLGTAGGSQHAQGDGNGDGSVDAVDLGIWSSHFGEAERPNGATVPEPPSWAICSCWLIPLVYVVSRKSITSNAC